MSSVVVLGWGSLIDRPAHRPDAPLATRGVKPGLVDAGGSWLTDGPALPLELARLIHTPDVYPSWVISPGSPSSVVLYAPLAFPATVTADLDRTLHAAVHALAAREGVSDTSIGRWPSADARPELDVIAAWAMEREIAGVVWTALPPKWNDVERVPTEGEVIALLRELVGRNRADFAEKYIRTTPRQITSPYRSAIERELGWLPT